MTGPEHYRKAEVLLANQRHRIGDDDRNALLHPPEQRAEMLAWAQVHATLALAAATAAEQATAYDGDEQHQRSRGWSGVA